MQISARDSEKLKLSLISVSMELEAISEWWGWSYSSCYISKITCNL